MKNTTKPSVLILKMHEIPMKKEKKKEIEWSYKENKV
jgi:hypothetical protein